MSFLWSLLLQCQVHTIIRLFCSYWISFLLSEGYYEQPCVYIVHFVGALSWEMSVCLERSSLAGWHLCRLSQLSSFFPLLLHASYQWRLVPLSKMSNTQVYGNVKASHPHTVLAVPQGIAMGWLWECSISRTKWMGKKGSMVWLMSNYRTVFILFPGQLQWDKVVANSLCTASNLFIVVSCFVSQMYHWLLTWYIYMH